MSRIYLLQHSYEHNGIEETKIIGIFSSKHKALEVIEQYKILSGFKNHSNNFYIDEYQVDKNYWEEGF